MMDQQTTTSDRQRAARALRSMLHAVLVMCSLIVVQEIHAQSIDIGDCDSAAFVCSDTLILGTSFSTGAVNDLASNFGCLFSGERAGAWIQCSIATAGLLGFVISPDQSTTDLDFALWGPYSEFQCPQPTDPVRCSFASRISQLSSNVGLAASALDTSEVAPGDGILALLPVNAGELYVLYVNNFSMSGDAVGITWTLLEGASLSCSQPFSTGMPSIEKPSLVSVQVLHGSILLNTHRGAFEAQLIDLLGRPVLRTRGYGSGLLDITSLAPGRYVVVEQFDGEGVRSIPVVIP